MKYLFSALLLLSSFAPLAARADLILEGEHPVNNCAILDDVSAAPGYDFYLFGNSRFPTTLQLGTTEHCGLSGMLFAVKSADVKNIVRTDMQSEEYGNWPNDPANKKYIVWSTLETSGSSLLPDVDPTAKILTHVVIDGISAAGVSAHIRQVVTYDANGKVLTSKTTDPEDVTPVVVHEEPTAEQDEPVVTPQPTVVDTHVATSSLMPVLWITIVCAGAVLLAVAVKSWKK